MKAFNLILAALFLFTIDCYSQGDSTCPLTMSIKLEKTYQIKFLNSEYYQKLYAFKGDSLNQTMYDIQINLKNTSKKSVFIWLMTCSWLDNFLVNNNYIGIGGQACDSNFPNNVEIKPDEIKTFFTTISKSLKFDYDKHLGNFPQVQTTKLGLITISNLYERNLLNGTFGYELAMEDKSCWKIIWSNPLYLLSEKEAIPDPIIFDIKN